MILQVNIEKDSKRNGRKGNFNDFDGNFNRDQKKNEVKSMKNTRLDVLKQELAIIKGLKCLSFSNRDACVEYYEHEIECIEKWGAPNPEYDA